MQECIKVFFLLQVVPLYGNILDIVTKVFFAGTLSGAQNVATPFFFGSSWNN
jgi:hypothetical protein